jgi:hypothetical protein
MKNTIKALFQQITTGKSKTDRDYILSEIKIKPRNFLHFKNRGFLIQTWSARISELEKKGLIKKHKTKDRYSLFSFVESEQEQKELVLAIELKEAMAYFQKGLNNGYLVFDENLDIWKIDITKIKF